MSPPLLHDPSRKLLRPLLASLAVGSLLLTACGGDDKEDAKDTTTTEKDTTTTEASDLGDLDVCELLELDALSTATGEEFVNAKPEGEGTCVYSNADDTARIGLNVGLLEGTSEQEIATAKEACDEGSAVDVSFDNADAGFACLQDGIPLVGAASDGKYAVLSGATANPDVSTDQVLEALAGILNDAING